MSPRQTIRPLSGNGLSMSIFFFFNDTATTEIYTLSLHDALPISLKLRRAEEEGVIQYPRRAASFKRLKLAARDRKSTRLNSSHGYISYAVFCLKKKKKSHGNQIFTRLPMLAEISLGYGPLQHKSA